MRRWKTAVGKWLTDISGEIKYAFMDGIAVMAATIDFFVDVFRSMGHPHGSWIEYIRHHRGAMGWFLYFVELRNSVLKTNPSCKFFLFMGKDCVSGNSNEMTPEMRHLLRNKNKILEKLSKADPKNGSDN